MFTGIYLGFLLVLIIFALGSFTYVSRRNTIFTLTDEMYQQAGIEINYGNQTITYSGKTHDISTVKDIKFKLATTGGQGYAMVFITVSDLNNSIIEKKFLGAKKAQAFAYRLCVSTDKAGGSFTNNVDYTQENNKG